MSKFRAMKTVLPLVFALFLSSPALAAWQEIDGGISSVPNETNSTIQAVVLHCVDGAAIDVYSGGDGTIKPAAGGEVVDYFYKPGFIRADVDGSTFPMVAAGSGDAVVLFSEGKEAESYMAPLDDALIGALTAGKLLTLAFDLNPTTAADGSTFETFATFDLDGHGETIRKAVGNCE
ncbi:MULTISPECIES: hypothetical protein [unclassified Mesorhizobium]|uniref:hypothetical protein n=1 Tax=unclassified Mesorhizobium TaxID=325217 RepID=UPI0030147CF4